MASTSAGQRFRDAVARERPLQVPGAINAYHAILAEKSGFCALYLSGGGVAAGSLGMPDLGISNLADVLTDVRRITDVTPLPLLVDVDTGFDARTDAAVVIMARTDALAVEGLDAAIARARACVEAGADMIFPEAITELAMYKRFTDAVQVPVLANITEFGATPLFTVEELQSANVGIALYPLSAFRAMNKAAENVYTANRRDGTQKNVIDTMKTRMELYDRINYHEYERKLDALFAQQKTTQQKIK